MRLCWGRQRAGGHITGLCLILLVLFGGDMAAQGREVASVRRPRIAIFKEPGFPAIGTPKSLTPEWLYAHLAKDFSVRYLNLPQLSDSAYLNRNNFDLLILPYGEAFPYRAFPAVRGYLFAGGGLFNVAGRPFWAAFDKVNGTWAAKDIKDPYREYVSPLGIKYYESPDRAQIGLSVTTSLRFGRAQPTRGNIFPYRVPSRDFYSLGSATGAAGTPPIILIKSWRNPYLKDAGDKPQKWCLIGSKGENHPLNPESSRAEQELLKIMEYLSYPVIIYALETDLPAYHQKEKVTVLLKANNNGGSHQRCVVDFEFSDKTGAVVFKTRRSIRLSAGQEISLRQTWNPGEFKSDFYKITVTLKKGSALLDKEEAGFVIINKESLKNGPSLAVEGDSFLIDGKKGPLLGVNYYESRLGELMWLRPNIFRVREDFKAMRKLGINFIRIHYHHSKWFRDYLAQFTQEEPDPYFSLADETSLPSERSLRILDAVIQLAREQGLIFCMDIFSLVPREMGSPEGWLGLKERIVDKDKILLQQKFLAILASRYKDIPGISWDLWNEPRLRQGDLELLRSWAAGMKEALRRNVDNHLVTIGDDVSLRLLDIVDYASVHTYEPAPINIPQRRKKPVIFQEVWNEAGSSLSEELRQAAELKKDFGAFMDTGAAGFVPWQWTRQARLWDDASDAEKWDNDLGLCVREDGTLKPAGIAYSALIRGIATNKSPGNNYLDMAQDYYGKRQYPEAIGWYKEAIKIQPHNSAGYIGLGRIYSEQRNYPEALKRFREAVKVNPRDGRGYEGLGRAYLYMGDYLQAAKWFRKAIKEPTQYNYACPYQGLGQVYQRLGKPLLAEENFIREIQKDPQRYKGYYDLAEYYCQVGRLHEAEENIEKALSLAANDTHRGRVLKLRGLVFIMKQDYAGAENIFSGLVKKGDVNAFTRTGLGHLYNARKDYLRARGYFAEAVRARGDGWDIAMLGLGWVNANEGKQKEAIACYAQVLKEAPLNILALLGMGNAYNWLREYDQAEKYFRRVIDIDPENEYALAELATVYLNKGEHKRAEGLFARSLALNSFTYSCPYEGLGLLYLKQNKLQEAEKNLKRAIEVNPNIEYKKYNGLARIYIRQGKIPEAKSLLNKSISNYPYDNEAKELLEKLGA